MWGDVIPTCGDFVWGDVQDAKKQTPRQSLAGRMEALFRSVFARLDQTQFDSPFDGRPAIIDVEFVVDAFGMCADRAQSDDELTGNFGPRQLCFEQAQNIQLTLTERLNQGR